MKAVEAVAGWMTSELAGWVAGGAIVVGLPVGMLLLGRALARVAPHWRRGTHNDVAGIMISAAAVVYAVAIGLVVVTLWEKYDNLSDSCEQEASNLAAIAEGAAVFDGPTRDRIRAQVVAYNKSVVDSWDSRVRGTADPAAGSDLAALQTAVAELKPASAAQQAYVVEAVRRLGDATELRMQTIDDAQQRQLPDVMWIAVLGGSAVLLGLCLVCGVQDDRIRQILLVGVAVTVAINIFLVVELNSPLYGSFAITPRAYQEVADHFEAVG